MYRFIHFNNLKDGGEYEFYTKDIEDKEAADKEYAEFFAVAKRIVSEMFEELAKADVDSKEVVGQIINAITELEVNEEADFKAHEKTFLTSDYMFFEFNFANKHIVSKVIEV